MCISYTQTGSHNTLYFQPPPPLFQAWFLRFGNDERSLWKSVPPSRLHMESQIHHIILLSEAIGSKICQQQELYLDMMSSEAENFLRCLFLSVFKYRIARRTTLAWSLWIMEDQKCYWLFSKAKVSVAAAKVKRGAEVTKVKDFIVSLTSELNLLNASTQAAESTVFREEERKRFRSDSAAVWKYVGKKRGNSIQLLRNPVIGWENIENLRCSGRILFRCWLCKTALLFMK